jgi:hypothetical protein
MCSPKNSNQERQSLCTATAHNRLLTIHPEMLSATFLDNSSRPSFNLRWNYGSSDVQIWIVGEGRPTWSWFLRIPRFAAILNLEITARPAAYEDRELGRGCHFNI